MEIADRKQYWRSLMLEKRKKLTLRQIEQASRKAMFQLFGTKEYARAEVIFAYASYQQELSTMDLIEAALADGKVVAVPKVQTEAGKRHMEFYRIQALSEMKAGYRGILEPSNNTFPEVPYAKTFMLLPGVLFDRAGNRLGYGGGFYDTYLERSRKKGIMPILAGYSYDFAMLSKGQCPVQAHDQRMDMVVTPSEVIYFSQQNEIQT